jgi:hypothetical protein
MTAETKTDLRPDTPVWHTDGWPALIVRGRTGSEGNWSEYQVLTAYGEAVWGTDEIRLEPPATANANPRR